MAPQRRPLLALRQPRRAARLAAVVLRHAGARRAGHRGRARGARALHAQEPRAHLLRLDGADPALVRLAPALVGPPAAGLVLLVRRDDRAGRPADALPVVRLGRAHARPRRARHVVLLGALAVRDARLARRDAALRAFYPGHVLFTARDIINLWVARMMMMGIAFTGDEPFHDVVIHPTVLAADGRRMSKSLGTGIDPLDLIAEHGADATRYGLLKMSSTQDVRFARRHRGGPAALQQALERGAPDPAQRRSRGRARARRRGAGRRLDARRSSPMPPTR